MKILKTLGVILVVVLLLGALSGLYVNYTMPNVGNPPEIIIDTTAQRIERGKYLANHVTLCMDCHSKRDWSIYSGPMIAGTDGSGGEVFNKDLGFPGTVYASNITPANLSTWTDGEIYRAVTAGVGKDGHALFPVMAYPRFGKMDQEDIYSIIAYIRSLKPIKTKGLPKPQLDFPVNILNKLGPKVVEHEIKPNPSDSVKYGAYLVNAAGCVDCHSKSDKGEVIAGTEFGGGMEFKQPAGILRSPNITMHPTSGLGKWTKEMFIRRFKAYTDSTYVPQKINPGELVTAMPWSMYGGMTEQDLGYIFTFLKSIKPQENKVEVRTFIKP
jgi:hypothetical protein